MAVSYVGYDWGDGNNAAVTPSIHPSTQAGDLLVAVCYIRENAATYSTPSGWTAWVDSNNNALNFQAGQSENSLKVFWKFYQNGDPTSYTFTPTGGGSNDTTLVQILTFRGVDTTTPFTTGYYLAFQAAAAATSYHSSPDTGDTSLPAGCAMLGIMGRDVDDTVFPAVTHTSGTAPSWTGQASAISALGTDASCHVHVAGWSSAATSYNILMSFNPAANGWNYGVSVVLKPATGGSVGSHTATGGVKAGGAAASEMLQPYGNYTGVGGGKAGGVGATLFYTPVTIGSHTVTGGAKAGGVATSTTGTVEWYQACPALFAATPTDGQYFGTAVALSADGRTLAVSTATGTVSVYRWGGVDWSLLTSFSYTTYTGFGSGLHIPADDALFIVCSGYPGRGGELGKGRGFQYGFLEMDNWPASYELDGGTLEAENDFDVFATYANARCVAVNATMDKAVLGIPGRNHNTIIDLNSNDTGWAIYQKRTSGATAFTSVQNFPGTQEGGARFGDAVSVDRSWTRLCISETEFGTYAGRIWTYAWGGTSWSEVSGSKLDGTTNQFLGKALTLTGDGNRLFFTQYDSGWQTVHLADWASGVWSVSGQTWVDPEATDTSTANGFGESLSVSGDGRVLVVGQPRRNVPPAYQVGCVYTYFRLVSGAFVHAGAGSAVVGGAASASMYAADEAGVIGLWSGWDQP